MLDISAVTTLSSTFPKYLTYATSVPGWSFMYMHRKLEFEATGSDMATLENMLYRVEYDTDFDPGGKFHSSNSLRFLSRSHIYQLCWHAGRVDSPIDATYLRLSSAPSLVAPFASDMR